MTAVIIAVGSELLTPFRVDTNSLAITDRLNAAGIAVRYKAIAGDSIADLEHVFKLAIDSAELVVCTGGLGPTGDDLTREAVSQLLQRPLAADAAIVERIRERFAKRGLTMPAINERQAMVPRGAVVLENEFGTAPGLWLEHDRGQLLLLPGPPREMTPMLERVIRERLAPQSRGMVVYRRALKITGRTESDVDSKAQPVYVKWIDRPIPISTTILAVLGQIELHLTATSSDRDRAERELDQAVEELRAVLGSAVYSIDGRSLEAVVGDLLRSAKWTIAAAESCTGGLLTSRLTDVPGSSDYVAASMVCYTNQSKTEWLGVPEALLAEHGAVSEPVASAMASGIRLRMRTNVGVGITGIAGPGGGSAEKPVGTVVVAVTTDDGAQVRTFRFFGAREQIKYQSAQAAMNMLRLMMTERVSK
ncbi:MAG TPA: competence/damage-inducible protein A [Vicinamibacterales bacterium]|nr:competence/damage-inducible protein A [Vicinamibacterales bacterium]